MNPLHDPALQPILAALPRARLVGGAVRDHLTNRPIADIDLATPDTPEEIIAALMRAGLKTIPTGLAHGTVTALSDGRPFEITTLRRDVATDGRHATVAWTDDWQEDAARRDFTINAMSLDQAGQLHDFFQGAADLSAGVVRFVGNAEHRVAEDFLRSLRFFRFYARYGRGAPDQAALAAIHAHLDGLHTLSAERIWSELKRILAAPEPGHAVSLMAACGVLKTILPGSTDPAALQRLVEAGAPADPLLRFAALSTAPPALTADALKISGQERDRLTRLAAGPTPGPTDAPADLRRYLAAEPASILIDRTWLANGAGPDWDSLRTTLAATEPPSFPLEGRHALQLGASPGPAVGRALAAVRARWLAGGCVAGPAECLAMLGVELGKGQPAPAG